MSLDNNDRKDFIDAFEPVSYEAHRVAVERGYLDHIDPYLLLDMVHHVECELKELIEVFARQRRYFASDKIPSFNAAEEEWADCVLKLMRIGVQYNLRPAAILAKLDYENTRKTERGGKIL